MQKDYIFFDFDGTLVDTSSGIFDSLRYAFDKMGEPALTNRQMRKYIGPPLEWSFVNYNHMSKENAKLTAEHFRVNYAKKGVLMHSLYPDIDKMLKALKKKGKSLAVATSKPEDFAVKILKSYNLFNYFDVVSGATFDGTRNSKKEVLIHAVNLINPTSLKKCVLIGDTKNDVIGANEVGMDCIGILYGFGTKDELLDAGAIAVADTPTEALLYLD